ncbi:unnamed protein product (macronuclear) [Paramecium tetraurelia]|uniref:Uncharacterized protein n=1 Tax=Paramecium tetraurelia TaxID=5888 RepID=A0DH70_PARTE|nr:uncharacterized protein GSPATT00016773001 [Paramecium tetraurelia]CAK82387.1 unnamed protein product [Paramecium tetraurelia]|eukprot:XP_001449784.1 hypothetical protein (macronuclear) [Paramecium tetraurelia strain d4-2]
MIIQNLQFEEIIIKPKSIKNKNAIKEKLQSDKVEEIDINEIPPSQILELFPNHVTLSSTNILSELMNTNLSDDCLYKILGILVQWDNQNNVDFTKLYKQLFYSPICKSILSGNLNYSSENLIIIVNQLISVFQSAINDEPSKIENITSWISILVENNKLSMPKKETQKLLELLKQYQNYQESIRNIKRLINFSPVQQKKENKVTQVYF